jgi:choline dehydrogenase-like flavoprotein
MVDAKSSEKKDREWDVVIVGSGFAGALIAHALGKERKNVLILEAGAKVPTNINEYMNRFYLASAKVPESPYTPAVFGPNGLADPATVNAGRPTVLALGPKSGGFGDWTDPKQSYLIQTGPRPFTSNYDRVAGGTSHWLGTSLRFVPNDFKMKSTYGQFVDWPSEVDYGSLERFYCDAEVELGVSADKGDQEFLGIKISKDYPMPKIPQSTTDKAVSAALDAMTDDEVRFLQKDDRIKKIGVRSLPAARNSQPYRNRRACAGNTNCIPICPIQAKYDPTITLNDAMDTGFVKMWDRTVASEIVVGENGNIKQINFIQYQTETVQKGIEPTRGSVRAKVYVIAANAIETARLLLMSRNGGRTPNGVANSSDMVGRNLMDHPYLVAWGMSEQQLYPYRGPLITSGIGDLCDGPFRRERGAFRVDIGNEGWNFVVKGDPNMTTLDLINGTDVTKARKEGESGDPLFGKTLMQKLNDRFTRQFRCGFLIEQSPEPGNRVTLSQSFTDGLGLPRPQISYDVSDYTRKGFVAAYKMKNLLFARMGVRECTSIDKGDPTVFVEEIDGKDVMLNYMGAGHIMGTYRMGTDKSNSVVNHMQRSWDHPNLYLVGSGTFPTGATANPTLTISALSLRTADYIVKNVLR